MPFKTYLSLYWENFVKTWAISILIFLLFFSSLFLFLSLFFLFLMIDSCLFLQRNFWERYEQGFGAFILMEPNKYIFVHSQCRSRTFLDRSRWKSCFCAYSQCRSSAYIWWRVCGLDFKSMITFSTWVNKVWQSSTQKHVAYVEGFHHDIWPW